MKKHNFLRKFGIAVLLLSLTLTGCSTRTIERALMSETERYEDSHSSPFFWDNATLIEGYDNLYELTPFSFTGKPYNNVMNFGDNLLVIGEGYSANDSNTINHYFSIYSPWENRTLKTLDPDDTDCTDYQVAGDFLLLINRDKSTMAVYNTKLSLQHTYDISSLSYDDSTRFYAGSGGNVLYTADSNGTLLRLDISSDTLSTDQPEIPYYNVNLCGVSSDGKDLIITGIAQSSLKYVTALLSLDDLSTDTEYTGLAYYVAGASDDAFLAETNYSKAGWTYQTPDQDTSYFSLYGFQDISLLSNNQMLVERTSEYQSGSQSSVSFSLYDATGNCVSAFSYDLGVYDSSDQLYLSAQGAYLESCNCYFMILYDINCNPSFLVWNLNTKGTASDPITVYGNETDLDDSVPDVQTPENDSEAPEPEEYGDEVTAIADSDQYDWGDLSKAHTYAVELEQKYGIELYIGPEVPDMLDVFHVKQVKKPDQVMDALETLDQILSIYPANFFEQLCYGELKGVRIYLAGTISGSQQDTISDPSGFVNTINEHTVMVLDTDYSWDWNYTVNHELSHMIDRRLDFYHTCNPDSTYSEEAWNSYNPDNFTYLNSYDSYEDNRAYTSNRTYFIDSYGTTYATEDRSEIFGTAVGDYLDGFTDDSVFSGDSPISYKLQYYSSAIRDGFDTTGWPDQLPWETICQ